MDFNELLVAEDAAYPQPLIPYPNPLEAKKLVNDYGGRDSETTAVLQYSYQAYILKNEFPEYADELEKISLVELRHHELLGTTISALGGFPVIGGRNTFWNGSFVNYSTDLVKLLEGDIQGEELAIVNYEKTILLLQNDSIKQLLARIIADEKLHIAIFKTMLVAAKCR